VDEHEDGVLTLSWQPELADFVEAFRARNRGRKTWYKVGGMMGLALVVSVVALVAHNPALAVACVWGAIALPPMVLVVQPLGARSLWRRNPALRARLHAQVNPTTGIVVTGQSTGHHPWSTVHSVLETNRVFIVQISGYRNLAFVLLAKRGLPDQRSVDRLRTVLTRAVAPGSSRG
jgi:hypothetical protein